MVNTYKEAQKFQIGQELIATGAFVEGTAGGMTTAASGVAVAVSGTLMIQSQKQD